MSNMTDLWLSQCVFQALNTPKNSFSAARGDYDAPPDPLVGWRGDTSSPFPSPSTPSASRSRRFGASVVSLPTQIPGYAYDHGWVIDWNLRDGLLSVWRSLMLSCKVTSMNRYIERWYYCFKMKMAPTDGNCPVWAAVGGVRLESYRVSTLRLHNCYSVA